MTWSSELSDAANCEHACLGGTATAEMEYDVRRFTQ
jgi:hypothetical protein